MKILHIYKDYFPVLGGIENHLRQLSEMMVERGHEVEVLVTNPGRRTSHETLNRVKIIKAGRLLKLASAPISLSLPLELYRRQYAHNPPDIIHLHAPYPVGEIAWLIGSRLPRFGKKQPKVVITYHSDVVRQKRLLKLYAPFLRLVLKRVDLIVATSPNYIASSVFLQPLKKKCQVVPLAIDTARFENPDMTKAAAIRANYITKPDEILVLFTGRLRQYKGLQFLLEAMPQVDRRARLLVIGIGPMEQELKAQTANLNLGERVIFAGEIGDEDLPNYYAASDIFVLPSYLRSEAFGIVQLEAMAAGKPVISTELGTGTSYANLNGETGLVVPPADALALAKAINELAGNPQRREEMGQRGQIRTRAEFSLPKMADQIEKLYIELSS